MRHHRFKRGEDILTALLRFARGNEENYFTECVAHLLAADPAAARAFATHICGKSIDGRRISAAQITVQTQQRFGAGVPDMVLWINNTPVAIENKLFAGQGVNQLERYIKDKRCARLAYIAGYHDRHVSVRVVKHKKYLAPRRKAQRHFVWWEIFDTIKNTGTRAQRAAPLRLAVVQLFRDFGFEPVHGAIGDLSDPDASTREANRKRFGALWEETKLRLRRVGWTYFMTKSDAWANESPQRYVKKLWLSPHFQPGMLIIRMYVEGPRVAEVVRNRLEASDFLLSGKVVLTVQGPKENKGYYKHSVTAGISLQTLFGRRRKDSELRQRLADFCVPIVQAAG